MIAVVAILIVLALSKGGGLDALLGQQKSSLNSLEGHPSGQPMPALPESSAQRIDDTVNKILPAGAGLVGAGVCSYYGAAAVAPLCAKIASTVEPKARALANYTTVLATNYGGKALTLQANVINRATTGLNNFAANKVATVADKTYDLAGRLPGPFGSVAKVSILPVKVVADVTAKGAQITARAGGALVNGVKKGTEALSSGVNKVIHFGGLIGSSKLGRGSNGKDVFPNDMQQCQAMGITDVETCSQQFSLTTRKWSWQ